MTPHPPTPSPTLLATALLLHRPGSAAQYKDLIAQAEKKQRAATARTTQQGQALEQLGKAARRLGAGGGGGGGGGSSSSSSSSSSSGGGDAEGAADAVQREVASQLEQCRGALERVRSIKPDTGSLFVRLFLGKVNVRVAGMEDRHTLRDEYEKFRFRTNFGFIIFPLVWIVDYLYLRSVWKHTHWINILTHVWLLYYYVSLALRTNILKVVRFGPLHGVGAGRAAARRQDGSRPPPPKHHPFSPPPPPLYCFPPERHAGQGLVDQPPLRQRLYVHCGAHLAARVALL